MKYKKNNLLLIFICLLGIFTNAQSQKCDFQSIINRTKPYNEFDNKYAELLPSKIDIKAINISSFLLKDNYLGFTGKNKKRLKINLLTYPFI